MNRIEEFTQGGKKFMYFDFSDIKTDEEYIDFIKTAKIEVKKHPPDSIYTISNMKNAAITSNTHDIIADWVAHNKPYVKYGAVCNIDFSAKIIGKTVSIVTQRMNLVYVSSKEEAIEYLLNVD